MQVIDYIKANGLEKLQQEFHAEISDYPDRVVVNYSQIDSPRFHPIMDECRALILRKGTWEVMARSFNRFYNLFEGEEWKKWDPSKADRIEEKRDGSLLSLHHDGEKWCVSTRKKAFAEGATTYGRTFSEIFWSLFDVKVMDDLAGAEVATYVFEMTSMENRIVTRYDKPQLCLIGMRHNALGFEYSSADLDWHANKFKVLRPKSYQAKSFEEVKQLADALPALDEGFVLVWENSSGDHYRLKCKNASYLAIAHMRDNGVISPKRVMELVMKNDYKEMISYFPEDKPIYEIAQLAFDDLLKDVSSVYKSCKNIESQKDFALEIQKQLKYKFASGVLFSTRKSEGCPEKILRSFSPEKVSDYLNLKQQLATIYHLD